MSGPQRRTRILHTAHVELEAACEDARAACHGGMHDGLTEAFDAFIARVAKVSRAIAGPPPRPAKQKKAAHPARATPSAPANDCLADGANRQRRVAIRGGL